MTPGRDKRKLPATDDVLRRRTTATLAQLFELIHQVNPTGLALDERQRAARYITKGRLQSLLIAQFGDVLDVRPDPLAGEGAVSIRHRLSQRDACHARLHDLTPEARAFVQLQLDLGSQPEPTPALPNSRNRSVPTSDGIDLGPLEQCLHRADAALAEYDFEGAKASLTAAVQAACGSADARAPHAARRLLELLVDQLAETAEALAWQGRLPPAVSADASVRCLLALAAVREQHVDLAGKLIAGVDAERADEVRVELAQAALRDQQLDRCERLLNEVAMAGAHGDAARRVANALHASRAELASRREPALQDLLGTGDLDAAAALAREILSSYPSSTLARRVLADFAVREQTARIAAAAARVEAALASGDAELAHLSWKAAPELAASHPELEGRVQDCLRRAAEQQQRAQQDRIAAALDSGQLAAAVAAYWQGDAAARAWVQGHIDRREPFWIEELGPAGARLPERTATAVAGLLALELEPQPDAAEAVLAGLPPVQELLQRSAAARRLLQRTHDRILDQRRIAAAELLARAEQAALMDLAAAPGRVEAIDPQLLDRDGRARLAALQQRLAATTALATLQVHFQERLRAADLFAARSAAGELVRLTGPAESPRWRAQVEDLSARIDAAWIIFRLEGSAAARTMLDVDVSPTRAEAVPWLLAGGRQVAVVSSHGRWLFVRLVDLDDAELSSAVVLSAPEPMLECDWHVDGSTLWITDDDGHVLQLGLRPFSVQRWSCLRDVAGLPAGLGDAMLVGNSLWVQESDARSRGPTPTAFVVDCERWRVRRKLGCFHAVTIRGAAPPRVVVEPDLDAPVLLADERGAPVWRDSDREERFESAVVHPAGEGVLLVTGAPAADEDGAWVLVVQELAPNGQKGVRIELSDSDAEAIYSVATSLDEGMTVLAHANRHGSVVVAIAGGPTGTARIAEARIGEVPCLAQDAASRQVVALATDGAALRAMPMRRTTLDIASGDAQANRLRLPTPASYSRCRIFNDMIAADQSALFHELYRVHGDELDAAIRTLHRTRKGTSEWIALLLACPRHEAEAARNAVAHSLEELAGGGDVLARLALAEYAAREDRPARALQHLTGLDDTQLEAPARQHAHHLLGWCSLCLGDEAAAYDSFLRAAAVASDGCELGDWPELVAALVQPRETWPTASNPARLLVAALQTADRALQAGDAAAAFAALDHRVVWQAHDLQVYARLAAAALGVEARDGSRRFGVFQALAMLDARLDFKADRDLQLGSAMWSAERIAEVARRTREWLAAAAPGPMRSAAGD